MQSSHILSDMLHEGTILISHNYGGGFSMLTPSLSAFATFCEGHGIEAREGFYYSLPSDTRREMLAAMLRTVVGMERKEAYERGLCALPGDALSATPTQHEEGDAPEDEYSDVADRLPGCGRTQTVANVRPSAYRPQFV